MTGQLNDLDFGLYGYGKVLTDAGLFAVRGDSGKYHYIPTDYLWTAFDGRPDLDDLLFVLHELVLGMAHERMDFRTGKDRQEWAVGGVKSAGATDEGVIRLRVLLGPYIARSAASLVAGNGCERKVGPEDPSTAPARARTVLPAARHAAFPAFFGCDLPSRFHARHRRLDLPDRGDLGNPPPSSSQPSHPAFLTRAEPIMQATPLAAATPTVHRPIDAIGAVPNNSPATTPAVAIRKPRPRASSIPAETV